MNAAGILLLLCASEVAAAVNPCCCWPCQNKGVCVNVGQEGYECDCTHTGYYGQNCTLPRSNLIPSPPTYNSDYHYLTWEGYVNVTYFTRLLPPVPKDCPTPAGTQGYKIRPNVTELAQKFLLRRTFIPDPQGTNMMFAFFAQHFTHQFFRTDFDRGPGFTKALGHGVDLSHVYGQSLEQQHHLRLFKDGKLKFQVVNGEVYPPSVKESPIKMKYPSTVPVEKQLAVGHDLFGLVPGLLMYATLWLREHNRVCDILKEEHPTWSDEQLFQTTRLILIGETIKIVIEDYVQHLSGYHFKMKFNPELLFKEQFQYRNRIALEFDHLYHWHPLMPDSLKVQGREYKYEDFLFKPDILLDLGVDTLLESFTKQRAGRIGGGRNINGAILNVAISVIEQGRQLRLQPFNEYRKWFGLTPYRSFQELTGETEIAAKLEKLYGHIDAMELYPALLLETPYQDGIFGESIVEMGAPFSLKGLMGNPICSPYYWKPSTFGGQTGFNIVNTATLQKLVCLNTKRCPDVAFQVPDNGSSKSEGEREQPKMEF